MTGKGEEAGHSDKEYTEYDRYLRGNRNRLYGYNENIKEKINNETFVRSVR